MNWNSAQIEAFAPDTASLKAGQSLASAPKWQNLGCSEAVIWGECQGSGSKPYRTQIALAEPAFKCSCPSRKFPCKHALGLFLLYAREASRFVSLPLPDWVSEWLSERAEKKPEKAEVKKPVRTPSPEAESQRRQNVAAGLQDLRLWLEDLVRSGIAGLPAESYSFFDQMAARMVDAKTPGMARQIRDLASITSSGGNWAEQLLERLGLMQLLIQGYEQLDSLDPGLQAEIKNQLGWTQNQETLLSQQGTRDQWLILGQVLGIEDRLRIRRTWLLGRQSGCYALLLDFAFGEQPFKQAWTPGSSLDAELVWFPSSYPLRALVKPDYEVLDLPAEPLGYANWQALRQQRASALNQHPWLDLLPACLQGAIPHLQIDRLWLRDATGYSLPLWRGFEQSWKLLALSGGQPVSLSLEFDGERVYPLGVWTEEGYVPLSAGEAA
jgi:hypothetical protein